MNRPEEWEEARTLAQDDEVAPNKLPIKQLDGSVLFRTRSFVTPSLLHLSLLP